jgi:hypothetical protein
VTVCVYAVTRPSPYRPGARGLAGEALQMVRAGAVAAIVGMLPHPRRPTAANLRRYDAVVRALAAQRAALLPARFGTCFADVDELRFVLRSREATFRHALSAVTGRVQMTVRVLPDESGRRWPARGAAPSAGPIDRRRNGAAYLRAAAARAAAQQTVPRFDAVRPALNRWVRRERVEVRAGVASVYHLVPRTAHEAYRRALERAAARSGLRVVVSGPWPPYAFATD